MQYEIIESLSTPELLTLHVDCIIAEIAGKNLSKAAAEIDNLCAGLISEALELGELGSTLGNICVLSTSNLIKARKILLVQVGTETPSTTEKLTQTVAKEIKRLKSKYILWCLDSIDPAKLSDAVHAIEHMSYQFNQFKTGPDSECNTLEEVIFEVGLGNVYPAEKTLKVSRATAYGVSLCRDLGNLPPNICTPSYLADVAKQLSHAPNVTLEVLEQDELSELGMESFLCVARGSHEAPKLIVLRYDAGRTETAPIVLVGKGITFDSGGISIKPGEAMDEMKYDMCGAASVLGTMKAVIEMSLPISVYAVIPTCENMPSGNSVRPGDIVKSMSGKTIEVLNTDAEGRLILCDALTYVERFRPQAVIDVATLTGACVVALGDVHSGLFAREDQLAEQLLTASKKSSDTVWRMPLDPSYQEAIKSKFADLQNIGGRSAGSVTAACFLENFTRSYPWAHLDIAGTAWNSGANKGATGRPVRLLTQFIIDVTN